MKQLQSTIYYFVAFLSHVKSVVVRYFCTWSTFSFFTRLVCMNCWESWEILIFFVYGDTILHIIYFSPLGKAFFISVHYNSLIVLRPMLLAVKYREEKMNIWSGSKNLAWCNWFSFSWLPYWILKEAITRKVGKGRGVLKNVLLDIQTEPT